MQSCPRGKAVEKEATHKTLWTLEQKEQKRKEKAKSR
jgi:hypothetical protein